jgi:glycosyltransferase involved in cell wall biosynthesis
MRVITRLNIGGPSIQAIDLSSRLSPRGFETLLVHGRVGAAEGDMAERLARADPPVCAERVAALGRELAPIADWAAVGHVFRLMRDFRPAIVHTHMAKAGAIGRLAAHAYNLTAGRQAPARVVHTYHGHVLEGYFSPVRTRAFVAAERALARLTDRLVSVSPLIRDDIVGRYRIGRADQHRVIRLGFDLARFAAIDEPYRARARSELQIPADAAVVTTVGRLTDVKNHRLFLEAAQLIARRHPPTIFLIAGDGELRRELAASAASLGLAQHVRFLGWRHDLEPIYGATDVFLLTSRNEGTPVALIEAMASGCAGVATDVGGVRDVIEGRGTGRVARSDPQALAGDVTSLIDDPVERRRVGAGGRDHVTAHFTLARLLEDISDLYRDVLADAGRFRR